MSLKVKGIYQVLALTPPLTEAVTPEVVGVTTLSCTSRNATVNTCTVSVSDGWLKLTANVTGSVPLEGFG